MNEYNLMLKKMAELMKQNNKDLERILEEYNFLKEENERLEEENRKLKEFKRQVYAIWEIDEEEEGE